MHFEIGLMTGTFYNRNISYALDLAKKMKINNIEILVSKSHFDVRDGEQCDRVYDHVVELGLKVSAIHAPHTPYWEFMDISLIDEAKRKAAVGIVKKCIDFISQFYWEEKKRVVVHPGGERNARESLQRRAFYRSMNEILDYASKRGVHIALENMLPHLFAGRDEEFLEICTPFKREEKFGICFDTSHANLNGELYKFLTEILKEFEILEFHISDNHGHEDEHLLPFRGTIDWQHFFKILKRHNGKRNFMLEINAPKCGGNIREEINETLQNLHSVISNIAH